MGGSKAVLVSLFGILVGLGKVSCTLYTDLQQDPLTAQSNILPADTLVQSHSEGGQVQRHITQDETVSGEDASTSTSTDDLPSLAQFDTSRQDSSGMMNVMRSYNSPYSLPSRSSSSSDPASPASPASSSSSLLPLSQIPSSPSLSSTHFSRRVPSSRSRTNQLAQLVASRRRAARARLSELRVQNLRRDILNGLGVEREPTRAIDSETRTALLNWILDQQQTGDLRLAQRPHVQRNCYLGQCSVPLGVNATLWQDLEPHRLRLNFHLQRLNRRRGRREDVEQAELNLFVKPREGCPCVDENGDQIPGYIVSVHQFTRRLVMRKRRVVHRTIQLESVRIPFGGNAWVRLNITRAAQMWMSRPRRNLGLEVHVKHSNGTLVDARSVLGFPDCTATETERSCVHGSRPGIQLLPWPQTWHDRHLQLLQGRPYLDLRIVDRSRTSVDLAESFGPNPRRLGSLGDFLASQGQRDRNSS